MGGAAVDGAVPAEDGVVVEVGAAEVVEAVLEDLAAAPAGAEGPAEAGDPYQKDLLAGRARVG